MNKIKDKQRLKLFTSAEVRVLQDSFVKLFTGEELSDIGDDFECGKYPYNRNLFVESGCGKKEYDCVGGSSE